MNLAKELRIGNWVSVKNAFKEKHIQIESISESGINLELCFDTDEIESGYITPLYLNGEFNPIPLDEDWFKKFGFESKYEEFDEKDFPCVVEYWLFTNPVTRFEVDYSVKTGYTVNIANVPTGHSLIINTKLHYVHQLQNLFFAITGSELQFDNDQPNH